MAVGTPPGRDYIYYSVVHKKYSHIDYVFITQCDLPLLHSANIEIQTFLDHCPVLISLKLTDLPHRTCNWRSNPTLLTDPSISQKQLQQLNNTFSLTMSLMTIWEAHKCVIHCELIRFGAQKKRGQ